jgi:hypothetical protein
MCDYSLACIPNRLAQSGEELVVYRFNTGAIGLASRDDVITRRDEIRRMGFWPRFKKVCEVPFTPYLPDRRVPAVCVPPGARLQIRDLGAKLQREYGCGEVEEVVFTQTSADADTFRDAVLFRNGAVVLLQRLKEGQRVRVLFLSKNEDVEPAPTQRVLSR